VKSLFFAAHLAALAALTERPGVVSGLVSSGRPEQEDSDQVLGLLLNILPIRATVSGSWAELARAAFDAERETLPFRRFPLARIQRLAGRDRAVFEVAFNHTDFHVLAGLDALREVRVLDWWFSDQHSFPLMVEVNRVPGSGRRLLEVTASADSRLADSATRLGALLRQALERLAADPSASAEHWSVAR
jgi:hypothetical protein